MPGVPDKPSLDGLEARWAAQWQRDDTYRFDRTRPRSEVYAIDTPPPTVSGSLHVGHVFSFTHTDVVARFQRMRGKAVFYPIGWDDNGLATERRVQNFYGVRCDPTLHFDPSFEPPDAPPKDPIPISRPNFVDLCHRLVQVDEVAFEDMWRRLGLSYDWGLLYTTIGDRARRVSQRAFLRNLRRGEAYSAEAPTLWDVDFRTAVAQAELEDREMPGAYHRLRFDDLEIETTRPELLPACVALVTHPDDARYRHRVGGTVRTPLFGVEVPVVAHELADPEKGTGVAMICTFGDTTDVTWWRELDLPVRAVIGRDGRFQASTPPWLDGAAGAWGELAGKTVKQAQRRIVELLAESGGMLGEPKPITHPVKFYERGERPLEIVTSRQWYIRNGGRDPELRAALLKRGGELRWHPPYMQARYENWVEGLTGDWLISRQRFFGVPFPVWYPVRDDGTVDHDAPLLPDEHRLPVDPSSDVPDGYHESQRGRPGGFVADPDVMDTWATSSLTPHVAAAWEDDPDLFERVFPMDLRPQAHDIIRTWLFATVVRSHFEHGTLPWSDAAISGWILDPDRKKMTKSKGNVVTPLAPIEQYGADAVRYWAANGRPGTDTKYDEQQMKVGRRLAIKLLNATKFVLGLAGDAEGEVTEPLDRAMLAALAGLVTEATTAFEGYDYARAIERTEAFFWSFCDDHLELVKGRAYGEDGETAAASAAAALRTALSVLHRLFAPFLPFVTEEVWSWWQRGSIHLAPWPEPPACDGDPALAATVAAYLGEVRRVKSEQKRSQKTAVETLVLRGPAGALDAARAAEGDLRRPAGLVDGAAVGYEEADAIGADVTLAAG